MRKRKLIKRIVYIFFAAAIIYISIDYSAPKEKMSFGVTFSKPFAEFMGLDWKEAYLSAFKDLQVKKIRLSSYWNEIEPSREVFQFDDLDWQISEAKKNNADIILVLGQKQPRWPECHIPDWAKNLPLRDRQDKLMNLIKTVVDRYKNEKNIVAWQVENEFFFHFGECPEYDTDFFDKEISYVRSLDDSRPIIISDSGELSSWYRAAKRADILGTTMYRTVYNEKYGYFVYPIPASFYTVKAELIKAITGVKKVIVVELQGEAWGPQMPNEMTMEEQLKSMNSEKLKNIAEYARSAGFSESYFWGVEYWYWLKKIKGEPGMWEEAKKIFGE
ncbi:endo-1,4-beta-xylanase [Patescibacteria group bacterium]|nr:endo-1,4-beta-xylanase [Patescibacteria group bacterium]MBU4580189.1 endo-1,4-beta-xylanase [Patescibacteria group bacterium]